MAIEWKEIEQLFKQSPNNTKLKLAEVKNNDVIAKLGVNEQSVLGQVIINSDSARVNDYLNILSGNEESGIISFNNKMKKYYQGNKLIVAYDVWGGIFAIGNGDFGENVRTVWYYAPDSLQWECLNINYAEFVAWACSDNIKEFYKSFLWSDINSLLEKVQSEEAILVYPFLWSKECDIETADKKIVPIEEVVALNVEYEKKIG